MSQGYILIHRKIREKGFYKKSSYVHLWLELCLLANHQDTEFIWNGKTQKVKRGELLTGRKELSNATGVPQTTVEDILNFFEKEGKIRQQKTSKFRLISILKYNMYQNPTTKNDKISLNINTKDDICKKSDNRATTERHIQYRDKE